MAEWSLEIGSKARGVNRYVGMWEIEKLCRVVEGLGDARDTLRLVDVENNPFREGLYEGYRNIVKLAFWCAGKVDLYSEANIELVFQAGGNAMRNHVADILRPVLTCDPVLFLVLDPADKRPATDLISDQDQAVPDPVRTIDCPICLDSLNRHGVLPVRCSACGADRTGPGPGANQGGV